VPGGPEGPAGRGAEVRTMVRSDGVVFRFSRIFLTCEVEGRWIPGFFFTDESLFSRTDTTDPRLIVKIYIFIY
jgi:hypothetical protein